MGGTESQRMSKESQRPRENIGSGQYWKENGKEKQYAYLSQNSDPTESHNGS